MMEKNPLIALHEAFSSAEVKDAPKLPEIGLRVPLLFELDELCDDAWASWVGSRKACDRIASVLVKMKTQHSLSKATLKRSSFGVVLTTCLFDGRGRYEECCSALSPADAKLIDLAVRGPECSRESIRCITGKDASDLDAETIIELVGELNTAVALSLSLGIFNRDSAMRYVALHCLSERYLASKNFTEKVHIQFAIFNELSDIPNAELVICKGFSGHPVLGEFISIGVDHFSFGDPEGADAGLADEIEAALAVECLNYRHMYNDGDLTIAGRLRLRIEGWHIASEQMPKILGLLYSRVQESVKRLLEAYEEFFGLDFTPDLEAGHPSFERLPDLNFTQQTAVEASKLVIELTQRLEASGIWSARDMLMGLVYDESGAPKKAAVQNQIKALVESGVSTKNIAQLTALTLEAEQLVKRQQEDVSQVTDLITSSLESFSELTDQLCALLSDLPEEPSQEELKQVQTVELDAPVAAKSRDQEIDELHELLSVSQLENQQITAEMRKIKEDLHKAKVLNTELAEAKSAAAPVFGAQEADLIRRIGMREKITPVDVLEYYKLIAGERVVILDSAIKSAQDSKHFAYCDRMIDMLGSLCFQYFDSINSGKPDSVAREAFASDGYSARESETVLADSRLRAMREFVYQGETCLFKRHLRIGTGKGAANGMRIYFEMIDKKVVIAYAGVHLEVASSN
jgi:hypothetical protein